MSIRMQRRALLKRFASSFAAVAVAAHIPIGVITWAPDWLQHECALAYMRRVWNDFMRGHNLAYSQSFDLYVGRALYNQMTAELQTLRRESHGLEGPVFKAEHLMFKATVTFPDGDGWDHRFVSNRIQIQS